MIATGRHTHPQVATVGRFRIHYSTILTFGGEDTTSLRIASSNWSIRKMRHSFPQTLPGESQVTEMVKIDVYMFM
jgi:hypothetical protein